MKETADHLGVIILPSSPSLPPSSPSSFYNWKNQGSEKLNNLLRFTQLESKEDWVQTKFCLIPNPTAPSSLQHGQAWYPHEHTEANLISLSHISFSALVLFFPLLLLSFSLCLCLFLCLSLSLSLTHTHTHPHKQETICHCSTYLFSSLPPPLISLQIKLTLTHIQSHHGEEMVSTWSLRLKSFQLKSRQLNPLTVPPPFL